MEKLKKSNKDLKSRLSSRTVAKDKINKIKNKMRQIAKNIKPACLNI